MTPEIAFYHFQQTLPRSIEQALQAYHNLEALARDHPLTHFARGLLAKEQQDTTATEQSLFQAYRQGIWEAAFHLLEHLRQRGEITQAIVFCEKALADYPQRIPLWQQLIQLLELSGRQQQTVEVLRALTGPWGQQRFKLQPEYEQWLPQLHALALMQGFYTATTSPQQLLRQAKAWHQRFLPPDKLAAFRQTMPFEIPTPSQDPDKLRIGYVSNEWTGAAVKLGYTGLFRYHASQQNHDIYAVGTAPIPREYMPFFKDSLPLRSLSQLDVIVDLSGWLNAEIWPFLALRPCAVQVLMASNPPFFSGGNFFDAVVTHSHVTTTFVRQQIRALCVNADSFFHWQPPGELPQTLEATREKALAAFESKRDQPFKLGSASSPNKLSPETLKLWAMTLQALPESTQLTLKNKNYGDQGIRDYLKQRYQEAGGNPQQLYFEDNSKRWDLYHFFQEQHLILDSTPYSSALSACDAFWAGTPVMGIEDVRGIGKSIRHNIGRLDLLAKTPEDFQKRVQNILEQPQYLKEYAYLLPAALAGSPICQWQAFGQKMETLYENLWQQRQQKKH